MSHTLCDVPSQGVLEECAARQQDEVIALESILPAGAVSQAGNRSSGDTCLHFEVPVQLDTQRTVLVDSAQSHPSKDVSKLSHLAHSARGPAPSAPHTPGIPVTIANLPPIALAVRLPDAYPAARPPLIESITSPWLDEGACKWLTSQLVANWSESAGIIDQRHCEGDEQGWPDHDGYATQDGMECLFAWYELLHQGLWEDIANQIDAKGASADAATEPPCPFLGTDHNGRRLLRVSARGTAPSTLQREGVGNLVGQEALHLAHTLLAFDRKERQKAFEEERFECAICMDSKRGRDCYRLQICGHIFCTPCLQDYLVAMISDSCVRQATCCPDPACVKAHAKVENERNSASKHTERFDSLKGPPATLEEETGDGDGAGGGRLSDAELLSLVGPERFARLCWLREKQLVESDPLATYCPRLGCQAVARGDARDEGTVYSQMRTCGKCGFCWCILCMKTWHGTAPCAQEDRYALVKAYDATAEGSLERLAMERQYGRARLLQLRRQCADDEAQRASLDWIQSQTRSCPRCRASIQKREGCNHMRCTRCETHFCFRQGCGRRLDPLRAYDHFNTPGTKCFGMLFDDVEL